MQISFRLWPSYLRLAGTIHRVSSQGGWWYNTSSGEWQRGSQPTGPRNLDRGFRVVFGVTWPVKKTYRDQPLDYDASYLIVGED